MNKCSCSKNSIKLPIYTEDNSCCVASPEIKQAGPRRNQSFVVGELKTPAGSVPQIKAGLNWRDHWGTIKARWGVGRMDYAIDPGLYALGNPDATSPVLVSANYKMSFDRLREVLPGRNAWILALDTKGINVWCAAGKGTFGTEELVQRIEASGLKNVVAHRKIILPQLGAPGVAAHLVKKLSGFQVQYGPIRAKDLPQYLYGSFKTTEAMRTITFPWKDRAVLIPIELVGAIKPFLIVAPIIFILSGIGGPAGFWANAVHFGSFAVLALFIAILGGVVVNPLLLPYLPGRAFSTKGLFTGVVIAVIFIYFRDLNWQLWPGRIEALAWLMIIPAISAYLAVNFTGCSTYTSLSGVKKEMRWALPAEIALASGGLIAWFASRLAY